MEQLTGRLERYVAAHPVLPLALRTAVAAVVAWLVVLPLGGVADDYPYYAPLGAVVVTSTSVSGSIASSVETFLAIAIGACLAIGMQEAPMPTLLALGIVVGLGTLIGSLHWFGTHGSWVAIAGLFTLMIGRGDPWHFGFAYLGLTTLGAAVGILVNTAIPPLRLAEARQAQDALRDALVDQLAELAAGLEEQPLPTVEAWEAHRLRMEPGARHVQELAARAMDGPRVNWRVRRWRGSAEQLHRQGIALAGLAFQVSDITDFLADQERADRDRVPLGPDLRPLAADVLRATARALGTVEGDAAEPDALRDAYQALADLGSAVREQRTRTDQDLFAAGALVTGVRRVLLSVTPEAAAVDLLRTAS